MKGMRGALVLSFVFGLCSSWCEVPRQPEPAATGKDSSAPLTPSSGGHAPPSRCWQGRAPSEAWRGSILPAVFSFVWLLRNRGRSCCESIAPVFHCHTRLLRLSSPLFSVPESLFKLPLFIRTPYIDSLSLRASSSPAYFCKDPISKSGHTLRHWGLGPQHIF